jgi:DNA-directed RNA polymerase subunit RPC12/RpoP
MEPKGNVLYVYRCAECSHRGEQRLADDSHDDEASTCSVCGATVMLEWDGGVKFDTPKTLADEAIAPARERKS